MRRAAPLPSLMSSSLSARLRRVALTVALGVGALGAGAPRAAQAASAARLRHLLPEGRWPVLAAESRYRRRHGDPAEGA